MGREYEGKELEENRLQAPQIHIQNHRGVTKVYVDGKELRGVTRVEFSHACKESNFPVLKVDLLAEQICIDSAQIFALPDVYHPYYVSADKLMELGIITLEQLNELLEKNYCSASGTDIKIGQSTVVLGLAGPIYTA